MVVTSGAPLLVTVPRPVEPRSAQGAVRTRPARGPWSPADVRLTRHGRVVEVATEGLAPGAHELVVDELLDAKGERLGEPLHVPLARRTSGASLLVPWPLPWAELSTSSW